jgi:polyisoprenyl-phosphate glycosyltransferase
MSREIDQNIDLSVVLPVYNEAASVPDLLDRLDHQMAALGETRVEIILVDDGSTDDTARLLRAGCASRSHWRYLRLSRNTGSHTAILAGLERSRGRCAVFLASDLQDPPELIPRMLGAWRQGHHVVWAVRERREGISFATRALAATFYWLISRLGNAQIPDRGADFALLDRKVIHALLRSVGPAPSLAADIARLGFRQTQIPYVKERRAHGRSSWTLGRKLQAFADAFVSSTCVPLRAMSYLGLGCSLLGMAYAVVIIVLRVVGRLTLTGWPSLMVAVLVLGGVQMTMLGIIGEYLWRTLEAARNRPLYFLQEDSAAEDTAVRSGSPSGHRVAPKPVDAAMVEV